MRDPYCIEEDVRKRISECYLRVINDAEEQMKKVTADEEQGIQRYPSDNISIIWGPAIRNCINVEWRCFQPCIPWAKRLKLCILISIYR